MVIRFCTVFFIFILFKTAESNFTFFMDLVQNMCLVDAYNQTMQSPKDTPQPDVRHTYDFIIIGAGSAGSVLAHRLTENPDIHVLLIEAGGPELFAYDVPAAAPFLQVSNLTNWGYQTTPDNRTCLAYPEQKCPVPRGKVVGGCSIINDMVYSRGNAADYNRWEYLYGCKNWSYDAILPYFKKIEHFDIPELYNSDENGKDGLIHIQLSQYVTPFSKVIREAVVNNGINHFGSLNQADNVGVSRLAATTLNGTRDSVSRAYLNSIHKRTNFHLKIHSEVTKILIDPATKTAYGVEYFNNGSFYSVKASREVILSAGPMNSPKLLLLSGVGPAEDLEMINIGVIYNSTGVGKNYMDHIGMTGLSFSTNMPVTPSNTFFQQTAEYCQSHTGPYATPASSCEIISLNEPDNEGIPQFELIVQSMVNSGGLDAILIEQLNVTYNPNNTNWVALPFITKPKSRGTVSLASGNPFEAPLIKPNYFSHPADMEALIRATQIVLQINQCPELQAVGSKLLPQNAPQCADYELASYDYWKCLAIYYTRSVYHVGGTCRMGPPVNPESVVDPRLRFIGVNNLRVIDSSVFPELPSAHLNAVTMMVAEKGAEMLKEDLGI